MTIDDDFQQRNAEFIDRMGRDELLARHTRDWFLRASQMEYSYHFTWLGLPIIQFPQDVLAIQEIVWKVRPDLIVETGVARGGSLIFYASLLEMLGGPGTAIGIDIEIRPNNRQNLEAHPLFKRITLVEGSSVADQTVAQVYQVAKQHKRVLVVLDSHHTHNHALREIQLYSPLVKRGSYLIVLDTIIEDMPADFSADRPWGPGNNPKTAVHEFLRTTDRFEIDRSIQDKLQITVAPDGYLCCVKD